MLFTLSGMVTEVKAEHIPNAPSPMLVTPFPMVTEVKPVQNAKMVTEVKPVQNANA